MGRQKACPKLPTAEGLTQGLQSVNHGLSSHLKPWVQAQVPRGPQADLQAVGRPSAALLDKALTAHPLSSHWDSSFEDLDKVNFPHLKSLSPLVTT